MGKFDRGVGGAIVNTKKQGPVSSHDFNPENLTFRFKVGSPKCR